MLFLPWTRHPSPTHLVCYVKPHCCLCEQAEKALGRLERRGLAQVDYVSIVGVPELEVAYGTRIPVVFAGDEVLAEGKVSEIWLARRLAERASQAQAR
jgi:hypothetical protein